MLLSKEEAKNLISKILSYSKADSASVSLRGNNTYNLRFARNSASTNGVRDALTATITSNFGKRSGTVTMTLFDDSEIEKYVKKSEEIALLSPENKEFVPPPAMQSDYPEVTEFFEDTDNIDIDSVAGKISYTLNTADASELIAAGFFRKSSDFTALGNSNGLSAYHKSTSAKFSTTMRTIDSTGSSKIDREYADIKLLDIEKFTNNVAERALLSRNPQRLEPGKYVTILDKYAVCDMINNLSFYLNRRNSDEGRSFFSDKDKGNKIGEVLFNEKVNLYSDPAHPQAPASPFTSEGIPAGRTEWIKEGRLENLFTNRYWAEKTNIEFIPFPVNLIMEGSDKSLEDLIKSTPHGVFVTRLWYIRLVDPRQILFTGLTRDGVFLIEDGKIKHAVNNFRFNESPVNVLNNVIEMSSSEKVVGSETGSSRLVVPALKLSEFNFSTISDAV